MRAPAPFAVRLYGGIVSRWPAALRNEYGGSAITTFHERLVAARRRGRLPALAVATREIAAAAALAAGGRLSARRVSRRTGARGTHRDRLGAAIGGLGHDVRYALRTMRRHPGFSAAVLAMLCLGIGLNVATASLLDLVLLRELPFAHAARLVALRGTRDGAPTPFGNLSWLDLQDYRESLEVFEELGGFNGPRPTAVLIGEHPDIVPATVITPGAMTTLGVVPEAGRLLLPADHETGGVALLGHSAWQRRFGGDPGVLGRTVLVEGRAHEIVGVVPDTASMVVGPTEVWLPLVPGTESRGSRNLTAVGRLAPRVPGRLAQDGADAVAAALADRYPNSNAGVGVRVRSLHSQIVGARAPRLLLLLQGGALAVLLVVCANVANLFVARAVDRRHEVAVMRAMGASVVRVARPLLVEAVSLAGCGALLGIATARMLPGLLGRLGSAAALPRLDELSIDARLVAVAAALALGVAGIAAVVPAWKVTQRSLRGALAGGVAGAANGRGREALVIAQVAGTVVLVFVAGLLLASLRALATVDPGFEPADAVAVSLRFTRADFASAEEVVSFQDRALDSLAALPGVRRAGGVSMLPLDGGNLCDDAAVEGHEARAGCVEYRSTTPGYFAAAGMKLVAGRDLSAADVRDAELVAVVNQSFARLYFDDASPLGAQLVGRGASRRIVGVVEDVHHFGLDAVPRPEVYLPFAQEPFPILTLVVRAEPGRQISGSVIREALWSMEPRLALPEVQPLAALVSRSIAAPRLRGALFGALGALCLALSVGGIAGVLACSVRERQREIGIRMALGSRATDVRRLVVGKALRLTALGLLIGAAAAAVVGRTVRSLLFGVGLLDPRVAAWTIALITVTALLAAWAPARRAARIDPADTLRQG